MKSEVGNLAGLEGMDRWLSSTGFGVMDIDRKAMTRMLDVQGWGGS